MAHPHKQQKKRVMAGALACLCFALAGCGATAQLPAAGAAAETSATAEMAIDKASAEDTATAETATPEAATLESAATAEAAANEVLIAEPVTAEAPAGQTATGPTAKPEPAAMASLMQSVSGEKESAATMIALYLQQIFGIQSMDQEAQTANAEEKFSLAEQLVTDFCQNQSGNISIWAEDLQTGKVLSFNTEAVYYGASTLKAPYALWLCQKADAGQIDLDAELYNNHQWQMEDTMLEQYNESETVPVRQLLTAMIVDSDNNATDILMRNWPANSGTGYTDYLIGLGFSESSAETCLMESAAGIEGYVTVVDGAAAMQNLYDYFESDAPNAATLKAIFCQAKHDILYVPEGVASAKKYGSWDAAFHDEAIVYAQRPYLICCYTDWGDQEVSFPPEAVEKTQQLGRLVYNLFNG